MIVMMSCVVFVVVVSEWSLQMRLDHNGVHLNLVVVVAETRES